MSRAAALLRRAAEALVATLFGCMVLLFAANIAGRFLFNAPIIWGDEVLVLLMLWCTFLTAALVLHEREHVAFDLLYERLAPGGRRAFLIFGALLVGGIFAFAAPAMLGYLVFLWRERTNVLEIRLDFAYAVFGLFILALILQRALLIRRLLRRDWRAQLAAIEAPPGA